MERLTNATLSEKLEIPLYRMRKWTKEFLPADLRASRHSGVARELSKNEAFIVFLGGHLVSKMGFTFQEAREILNLLNPWLKRMGLFPEISEDTIRKGVDAEFTTKRLEVLMYFIRKSSIWFILASGIKKVTATTETDSLYRRYENIKTESIQYLIADSGTSRNFIARNETSQIRFEKINSTEQAVDVMVDERRLRILRILQRFIEIISGEEERKKWLQYWATLKDK